MRTKGTAYADHDSTLPFLFWRRRKRQFSVSISLTRGGYAFIYECVPIGLLVRPSVYIYVHLMQMIVFPVHAITEQRRRAGRIQVQMCDIFLLLRPDVVLCILILVTQDQTKT